MKNIKQYRLAVLEFNEDKNLLIFKVNQNITVEVEDINEMISYVIEFVGHRRHYAIVDFGSQVNSTTESRNIYAQSEYLNKYRIADAFIVETLALKLIANFFIKVTQPKIRTKSFTNIPDAMEWLEGLKKENPNS